MLFDPKWEETVTAPTEGWRICLLKAANLVRKRGLAKGIQEDKQGRVCLHGAISIAATGEADNFDALECEASTRVVKYLVNQGVPYLKGCCGAATWNNRPERTAEEVIAVLEAVARA